MSRLSLTWSHTSEDVAHLLISSADSTLPFDGVIYIAVARAVISTFVIKSTLANWVPAGSSEVCHGSVVFGHPCDQWAGTRCWRRKITKQNSGFFSRWLNVFVYKQSLNYRGCRQLVNQVYTLNNISNTACSVVAHHTYCLLPFPISF